MTERMQANISNEENRTSNKENICNDHLNANKLSTHNDNNADNNRNFTQNCMHHAQSIPKSMNNRHLAKHLSKSSSRIDQDQKINDSSKKSDYKDSKKRKNFLA